jgi:hypothetical protein
LVAGDAYAEAAHCVVYYLFEHELVDGELCQLLLVILCGLLRVLLAHLLELVVELFPFFLILGDIDLLSVNLRHVRAHAEEVAAVGQRIADDECQKCEADHYDQQHRFTSDFL